MRLTVFSDTDWLYPDSAHSGQTAIELQAVRGGHCGAQILGEAPQTDAEVTFCWEQPGGPLSGLHRVPKIRLYQLLPVGVNENTAATLMTTTDFASCRSFVTRKAPFAVYDALRPVEGSLPAGERLALYLCVETPADQPPGQYAGTLTVRTASGTDTVPLRCTVHALTIPPLAEARLGMLNFFSYDGLAAQHAVPKNSPEYWQLFRAYVRAQIEMRCTHILLPAGEPVYEGDALTGFDFSAAERAGQIARQEGAQTLCGGHIAHWHEWDDDEYYPNWDPTLGVTTNEGYLQLRLYFSQWAQVIRRNHWEPCMTQALADEPQTHNDRVYRILAAICRKFLPGIPILDAVETTHLGGGIDIWVPKQDTYEKWREEYTALQAAGEELWFYTCAFPAGPAMNRSMDLPLSVSRLILWMGAYYRLSGFLHWGFNYYIGEDIWHSACCPHKGALLPAGDAHIVYPGEGGPLHSMRYEAQRAGAEDYELLVQALATAPEETEALIRTVCTDSRHYTRDGAAVLAARDAVIRLLEGGSADG